MNAQKQLYCVCAFVVDQVPVPDLLLTFLLVEWIGYIGHIASRLVPCFAGQVTFTGTWYTPTKIRECTLLRILLQSNQDTKDDKRIFWSWHSECRLKPVVCAWPKIDVGGSIFFTYWIIHGVVGQIWNRISTSEHTHRYEYPPWWKFLFYRSN